MMKTSILPQVVRSAAPSVSLPFFPSGSHAHDFISAPFIFRRFFLPPLFPLPESVRPFIVFDQRCEMGSMIHSSLSSSTYPRLRNLLARPEILLGAEMVARPLASIFCPKDLFMFYHS